MYVLPDALLSEILLAIEGDTAIFPAGWDIRLFSNDITPDPASVIGDFVEVIVGDVPGYAPVAGSWAGVPVRKADGSWEDQGTGPSAFQATGATTGANVAFGWFATEGAGATLVGSGRFDDPFNFAAAGDGFLLENIIRARQGTGTDITLTLDMEME